MTFKLMQGTVSETEVFLEPFIFVLKVYGFNYAFVVNAVRIFNQTKAA